MEKRPRIAGRLIAGMLALVLLVLPAAAQDSLAALAQNQGCTVEALLDTGTFTPGDSVSDWVAFAAGRSKEPVQTEDYRKALTAYVTKKYRSEGGLDTIRATEWHRISLTLLALGGDPTDAGKDHINLIADGTYDWRTTESPGTQGLNGWIFALLTLDSARFAVPADARYTRETILTAILSAQEQNGGFGLAAGAADVDITAMALQALAPYRSGTVSYALSAGRSTTVHEAVGRALQWLSEQQTENGDFNSWGAPNAESTAQVIIALCALGIDPASDMRFCKSGGSAADGLARYRQENGLYAHVPDAGADLMATQQAILAEEAMERLKNGERSLYDFRAPMEDGLRAAIAALNDDIFAADAEALRAQADALYVRYRAIPAEERSYVFAFERLRTALEESGCTLEPENPAAAYDLRQPAAPDDTHGGTILCICGGAAAAAVLAVSGILWKRKQKCTK